MFQILTAAVAYFARWLLGGIVLKFIGLTLLVALLGPIVSYLVGLLAEAVNLGSIGTGIGSLPSDVLYFLLVFRIDLGLPIILGALILRFTIRRLPVIG